MNYKILYFIGHYMAKGHGPTKIGLVGQQPNTYWNVNCSSDFEPDLVPNNSSIRPVHRLQLFGLACSLFSPAWPIHFQAHPGLLKQLDF